MEPSSSSGLLEEGCKAEILRFVEEGVQTWYNIIRTFGVDDNDKTKWEEELKAEFEACVNYCNNQAKLKQQQLHEKIASLLEELQKMHMRLGVKMPQYAPTNKGLYNDEKYLIEEVRGIQEAINKRMVVVDELKARRDEISKSLGRSAFHIQESPLPSQNKLQLYLSMIQELEDEKERRIERFRELREKISAVAAEIHFVPKLDFERDIISGDNLVFFEGTDKNMQHVEDLYSDLVQKRDNIENDLAKLRENVQYLWKVLEEDIIHCNAFIRDNAGNNLNTLEAFQAEMKRCEELRKTNLKKFIDRMRVELVSLWNEAGFNAAKRIHFAEHMADDLYTEHLLTLHDLHIEEVKLHLRKHGKIYDHLRECDRLYKKMRELEQRANAPDRYKNRGGQLLKEEKERKALSKKIPEVEDRLLELAVLYELQHGEKFMFLDETIESMIQQQRENMAQERKELHSARKQKRDVTLSAGKMTPRRLYRSPGSSQLPERQPVTPRNGRTPMRAPKTAPVRELLSARRSITKAKARLSANKKKRIAAMRASIAKLSTNQGPGEYDDFETELAQKNSARSTIGSNTSSKPAPSIEIQTPRTVERMLTALHKK